MGVRGLLTIFQKKKNIWDVLEIYMLIGKFAGFTVYSTSGTEVSNLKFSFSFDDAAIYLFFVGMQVSLLYFGRLEPKDQSSMILTFGTELILTVSLITGIISASIMIVLRNKLLQILKLIDRFDYQIVLLGGHINYDLQFFVFASLVMVSTTVVLSSYFFAQFFSRSFGFGSIGIMNFTLSNINFTVLMGFFLLCLLSVRYRIHIYNKCFEKHFEDSFQPKIIVQPASNTKTETTRTIRGSTVNRFGSLHNNLCDMVELINVCFGFQAMLFTGMCFTYSIFSIFASFRMWYTDSANIYVEVFKYLIWAVYYYAFELAIISTASSVTRSGKSTAITAHKAINTLHDPFTIEKLRLYAQQVVHRPPVVTCGLFIFDWTLFYSMCGASTTYLVILIQFDTSIVNSSGGGGSNSSSVAQLMLANNGTSMAAAATTEIAFSSSPISI